MSFKTVVTAPIRINNRALPACASVLPFFSSHITLKTSSRPLRPTQQLKSAPARDGKNRM